jgi:hypothetical protein
MKKLNFIALAGAVLFVTHTRVWTHNLIQTMAPMMTAALR